MNSRGVLSIFVPRGCAMYFSPIFSRIGYHLKAKILEQDEQNFSWAHHHANLGQVLLLGVNLLPSPRLLELGMRVGMLV